ncbi:MAG: FRG domain-containing protein [Anaerolineaceae bacterium]
MRNITATLSPMLAKHVGNDMIRRVAPYPIDTYPELVQEVADLAYLNKDFLLFYRGQDRDYLNKADTSTYYPTIYRKEVLTAQEARLRFDMLELAEHQLADAFDSGELEGRQDVRRKSYIAWSLLQHYGVCDTPLLDLTQSLGAAATFAQYNNEEERGVIAVFGLPYPTNRITYNSEHDLVIVRLLSVCPPMALRPNFQEGYLAGTMDITRDYADKSELDFNNRLIAKFSIPNDPSFWGKDFNPIPEQLLFPPDDSMAEIGNRVKTLVISEMKNIFVL